MLNELRIGDPRKDRSPAHSRLLMAASFVLAFILPLLFWWPLPLGGGMIGGDIYNYYFPLKHFYAEGLKQGELRLWHPGIGNGIPVLGESQTGVFYPPNLLAYYLLSINDAYSFLFLFHFGLATIFFLLLARANGLGMIASWMGAIVFVYGWFPPRACLEWAIVTGAWMPAILWAGSMLLRTGQHRWDLLLSLFVLLQLLAGHFNLAWITLLGLAWLTLSTFMRDRDIFLAMRVALAVVVGFLWAGPQLGPTAEFMQSSQRLKADFLKEVSEGIVPIGYLAQCVLPWHYYADPDRVLAELGTVTNKVEAHLYFGLIPLAIVCWGIVRTLLGVFRRDSLEEESSRRSTIFWWVLAFLGIVLAVGWPMKWLAEWPGFGYFRYAGRYGLLTQIAVALLTAHTLESWIEHRRSARSWMFLWLLVALTIADLWIVGRQVQYVTFTPKPVIEYLGESEVFKQLMPTDRVLSPDGNTLALSGASCVPPYVGLSPDVYTRTWNEFPNVFEGKALHTESIQQVLTSFGVTHVLSFEPLPSGWPATLIWKGYDSFLHPRWSRDPSKPLWLYRYDPSRGRAWATSPSGPVVDIREYRWNRVTLISEEDATIVLSDWWSPEWHTLKSGTSIQQNDQSLRAIAVKAGEEVVLEYHPMAMWKGLAVSLCAVVVAFGLHGWLGVMGRSSRRV